MRRRWISASPLASVAEVEQMMRLARVRHLPVEADGVLLGLIDHRHVLSAILARLRGDDPGPPFGSLRVGAVMNPEPPVARPDEALWAAARRMCDAGLGCLPVVEGDARLVGLVVESDLIRSAYGTAPAS